MLMLNPFFFFQLRTNRIEYVPQCCTHIEAIIIFQANLNVVRDMQSGGGGGGTPTNANNIKLFNFNLKIL